MHADHGTVAVSKRGTIAVLVVGASGFVGSHVLAGLRQRGYRVAGTQSASRLPGLFGFNLVADRIARVISHAFPNGTKPGYALVCAGIGSVEACSHDRDGSRLVNVTNTCRLIDDLTKQGFRTIYFSTSAVFDGRGQLYDESAVPSPLHEYGRQKAEVEHYVLSQVPGGVVVRLSKVVGTEPAERHLLSQWWQRVQQQQPIECVAGESFSPTLASDVATAIDGLIDHNASGLFHLAGAEGFHRDELARRFLDVMGANVPVVNQAPEHFGFSEPRPACSCLSNDKLVRATSMRFTPVGEILHAFRDRFREAGHGH
jgi:dTDP-4-dehydrorhamnose reductase